MADGEDDVKYPHDPYGNVGYPRNSYAEDDDNDDDDDDDDDDGIGDEVVVIDDDDDDDDDDDEGSGVQRIRTDDFEAFNDDDNDDDYGDLKHQKKKKLKTLLSSYKFAPRVPPQPSSSAPKPSHGGRNPLTDWTEHETFALLNAWGDRFLKQGRKSLRSEEWQKVAEKVSQGSKIERTDTQCRNRLDTLKKKYKKEKAKPGGPANNWIYYKLMDSLLSSPLQQQAAGLSCGVESGQYVLKNPKVNEMRDSPGDSESLGGEEDESESVLPKRKKNLRNADSLKLLADSIEKFSDIYKKTELYKREQMVELEKMRMDFLRDLEIEKREIFKRGLKEIEKIRHGDNEASGEDVSG